MPFNHSYMQHTKPPSNFSPTFLRALLTPPGAVPFFCVPQVNGVLGTSLGQLLQLIFCLSIALGLAFSASWQMALLVLGTLPLQVHTLEQKSYLHAFTALSSSPEEKGSPPKAVPN